MPRWTAPNEDEVRLAVKEAITDLEIAEREVESDASEGTSGRLLRAEFWGIRAATRKRLAEVEFLYGGNWRRTLLDALRDYRKGLEQGVQVDHWILGQYVVLRYLLVDSAQLELSQGRDSLAFWWEEAHRSVIGALQSEKPDARMWAHSSMADLLMIAQAKPRPPVTLEASPDAVIEQLELMIKAVGNAEDCQAIWPTFRQFWRWHFWWTNSGWDEAARFGYEFLWKRVEPRFRQDQAPAATEKPTLNAASE